MSNKIKTTEIKGSGRGTITVTDDPTKKQLIIEVFQDLGSPQSGTREAKVKLPRKDISDLIEALGGLSDMRDC